MDGHADAFAGGQQGGREAAGVDLVVTVDAQPAAYARGEHGLQAAALAAGEPLGLQAAAALQGVQFAQVEAVVGVEGDGEGAAGAVADVQAAARLGEFGGELRIACGGGEAEAEQGFLAVVQFGDGGEHAGCDLGGAAAGCGVGEYGAQSARGGPPGGDQADDSAPDDEDVGSRGGTLPR